MASYQTHQRDPLVDSTLAELLQKRGRELLGILLLGAAGLVALMLGSYSADDPGWMAASDAPVQNSLGQPGASVAAPLMVILGLASWGLAVFAAAWGMRLVVARGHHLFMARGVFLPIALALTAIWCATLVPGDGWDPLTGLGGIFGDTVLGAVVNALPMGAEAGVRLMSVLMLGAALGMWAVVLGLTVPEFWRFARFVLTGMILIYAGLVAALSGGAGQGLHGAHRAGGALWRRAQAARQARAARAHERTARQARRPAPNPPRAAAPLIRAQVAPRPSAEEPPLTATAAPPADAPAPTAAPRAAAPKTPAAEPQARASLVSRLKSISQRPQPEPPLPEPELVERGPAEPALQTAPPGGDRVRSRIADAIRQRNPAKPVFRFDSARRPDTDPAPAAAPAAPEPAPVAAHLSAELGPVPMPDWMMAAGPVTPEPAAPAAAAAPPPPRAPAPEPRRVVAQAAPPPHPSRRARAETQPDLAFDDRAPGFELPPLALLQDPDGVERLTLSDDALEENARMLENVLDDYGVRGEIVSVRPGPVVTQYELEPAPGLKASRVIGLADDIARSMSALSARVSTVPGRSIIGIELPNAQREKVVLREILAARDFGDTQARLPLALGKGIDGEAIVANLAKMPHLLIAGTTGSGKSVAINTMILSLLYRLPPEECRMIMIDPKMLELSVYDGIPHLLSPVVTDPKKAVGALKWVVAEMEERYRKMSKMGVRNIEGYNGRVREALARGEMFKRTIQTGFDDESGEPVFETEEFAPELVPYIVVVVDEMADLMMVAGKEIEACIQRLAQMARASGIHLIMATQRPSVDVITGTIKANFPTRISFQVTSKIDSRTILGEQGAEQLLGMGDMLYMAGGARLHRIHGPFVSDEEVEEVVNHLKSFGPPDYKSGVVDGPEQDREADIDAVLGLGGNTSGEDALYDQAVQVVIKDRKCSTSYIQRKLGIGYNKAARLVEQMETEGLITAANHVGKREILVPEAE